MVDCPVLAFTDLNGNPLAIKRSRIIGVGTNEAGKTVILCDRGSAPVPVQESFDLVVNELNSERLGK